MLLCYGGMVMANEKKINLICLDELANCSDEYVVCSDGLGICLDKLGFTCIPTK